MPEKTLVYRPETEAELHYFGQLQAIKAEMSLLKQERGKDRAYIQELEETNSKLKKQLNDYSEKFSIVELTREYEQLTSITKRVAAKLIKMASHHQRVVMDKFYSNRQDLLKKS